EVEGADGGDGDRGDIEGEGKLILSSEATYVECVFAPYGKQQYLLKAKKNQRRTISCIAASFRKLLY
ncbi:hypothetical protein ACFL6U_32600, partial [Planctomycetota bacterium]